MSGDDPVGGRSASRKGGSLGGAIGAGMAAAAAVPTTAAPGADSPGRPDSLDESFAPDPGLAGRPDRPVPGIDNGYLAGYRVRFDEAGANGLVGTGSLLRYAQDIAWRHSEDRGFDRRWYTDQGRWWVVRSIDLGVLGPVPMGRTLRVGTAVIGHRRIWARRRVEFRLADSSLTAIALVDWVLVDERGRILRIPPEFGTAFPNPEIEGEIIRAELPPAPPDATRHPIGVRPHDLDPMGHVNNAVYLDWAEQVAAAAGAGAAVAALPRRWRAEYAASAELGDDLLGVAWATEEGWHVALERPADGAVVFRARLNGEGSAAVARSG